MQEKLSDKPWSLCWGPAEFGKGKNDDVYQKQNTLEMLVSLWLSQKMLSFRIDFNMEYYEQAKWMIVVHGQSYDITQLCHIQLQHSKYIPGLCKEVFCCW